MDFHSPRCKRSNSLFGATFGLDVSKFGRGRVDLKFLSLFFLLLLSFSVIYSYGMMMERCWEMEDLRKIFRRQERRVIGLYRR